MEDVSDEAQNQQSLKDDADIQTEASASSSRHSTPSIASVDGEQQQQSTEAAEDVR